MRRISTLKALATKRAKSYFQATALGIAVLSASNVAAETVWWEGEDTVTTTFNGRDFAPQNYPEQRHKLSDGSWLAHHGAPASATYAVTVEEGGTYKFWTRKFWKHGPFRWRFDEGPWQTCGRDCFLADSVTLVRHICANWVSLGDINLAAGAHTLEIELLAEGSDDTAACFDCFTLTNEPFTPRGRLKPGESINAPGGWWAWDPPADTFSASPIDLRHLNEGIAGQSGRVRREGDHLVLGDGTPVRFWGMNIGTAPLEMAAPDMQLLARRLAKGGVNIARIAFYPFAADDPSRFNPNSMPLLHRLVNALKAEGIYTKLTFFFPIAVDYSHSADFPGYSEGKKHPFGLLFYHPQMQARYREWLDGILTWRNPETGVALSEEPALAILEIINEDSLLFWTFTEDRVPLNDLVELERQYGDWLAKKHGSTEKALARWYGASHERDDPQNGHAGLLAPWNLTAAGIKHANASMRHRIRSQVQFFTETMHHFYSETRSYIQNTLNTPVLVVASNWKTADPSTLDTLEQYCYSTADVIDSHAYFECSHEGPMAAYSVELQDTYRNHSAVTDPLQFPLRIVQQEAHPQTISELGWTMPNAYRGEATALTAAYGSLHDIDGIFWFGTASGNWTHTAVKFPAGTPATLGQFPATALAYRRGDIAVGPVVARETVDTTQMYKLNKNRLASVVAIDNLRASQIKGLPGHESPIHPLSFLAGRVTRRFGTKEALQLNRNLPALVNKNQIDSATKELHWNHHRKIVSIDAPCFQGAVGFLAEAGAVSTRNVTIQCSNDYATVLVCSLDGEPIATSNQILIQAFTQEKPHGYETTGAETLTITDLGQPPMLIEETKATVTIGGRSDLTATILDPQGYRTALQPTQHGDTYTLPTSSLYLLLETR